MRRQKRGKSGTNGAMEGMKEHNRSTLAEQTLNITLGAALCYQHRPIDLTLCLSPAAANPTTRIVVEVVTSPIVF